MTDSACQTCSVVIVSPRANQKFCSRRCSRVAQNTRYRNVHRESSLCKGCGLPFDRARGQANKVYCSHVCQYETRSDVYSERYRTSAAAWPPTATSRDVARYKRTLRADPCAYCGALPCGGVDHIEPRASGGDRTDWANMIGCCKRCNETKRDLPLLLAIPWIPVSRAYHDERRLLFAA